MNTAVAYAHRDDQDRVTEHRVVFTGETTVNERNAIANLFADGTPLVPEYAGLPTATARGGRYDLTAIRHVDEVPCEDMNVHDFVARLLASHWDLGPLESYLRAA